MEISLRRESIVSLVIVKKCDKQTADDSFVFMDITWLSSFALRIPRAHRVLISEISGHLLSISAILIDTTYVTYATRYINIINM